MPGSDLAQEAAELLSIANTSGARSLNQLVVLAARQVAACTGATAVLWRSEDTPVYAASHPDLPELAGVEFSCGRGPAIDALAGGGPVSCPDMLEETRWPEYADAALRCGVRCCITLAYRPDGDAVTLSLFGARPRSLESGQLALAELLTAFGGAMMGNAAEYGDTQRAALEWRAAAESRTLVDQAKGMLMHALGCNAEDALARMRQISQEQNLRVTDVAQRIIDSRGTGRPSQSGGSGTRPARTKAAGKA
jgi:ANTAR domain